MAVDARTVEPSFHLHLTTCVVLTLSSAIIFAEGGVGVACPDPMTFLNKSLQKCCSKCPINLIVYKPCSNRSDTVCGKLPDDPGKTNDMLQHAQRVATSGSKDRNASTPARYIRPLPGDEKTTPDKSLPESGSAATIFEIVLVLSLCMVFIAGTLGIVICCLRQYVIRKKNLTVQGPVPQSCGEDTVLYMESGHCNNGGSSSVYLSDDYASPSDVTNALIQIRNNSTAPADSDSTSLASSTESGIQDYNDVEICTMTSRPCLRNPITDSPTATEGPPSHRADRPQHTEPSSQTQLEVISECPDYS